MPCGIHRTTACRSCGQTFYSPPLARSCRPEALDGRPAGNRGQGSGSPHRLAWSAVLDLRADPIELTAALVDIPSVSRDESRIADAVEQALREQTDYEVLPQRRRRAGPDQSRPSHRVILAGHLDTVPIADNVPPIATPTHLWLRDVGYEVRRRSVLAPGCHDCRTAPRHHHGLHDCEEIEASANGLGRIERELPDWLLADVAILGEPSGGYIEAGCQGTLRAVVSAAGVRHTQRDPGWATTLFISLAQCWTDCRPMRAHRRHRWLHLSRGTLGGACGWGVAGNVIPDAASVTVNFRFAPDRSPAEALDHVRQVFDGLDVHVEQTDAAPGALPGLYQPAAAALVAAADGMVRAKFGWTDVSRFAALGIPAVNYGPGDPNLAHRRDERVSIAQITAVTATLARYLGG